VPSRKDLIAQIENERQSRVLCYVTGDRRNVETQIGDDVLPYIYEHLSRIGRVARLDLLLYSRGGNTLTGFALAMALREFGERVGVLVPFRAHSCATLISLGADEIAMGPFGQLSPVDPSITTPHGPTIEREGNVQFLPVSVKDVANYLELARKEVGLQQEQHLASVLGHLCERVSPLALGAVYRAREQIGMLATKLLRQHIDDPAAIDRVVKQLTRELLSHDYIVTRREARTFGLPVTDATDPVAQAMWSLFEDFAKELQLGSPWYAENEVKGQQPARKTLIRAVVESRDLKHVFESTYDLRRVSVVQKSGGKADVLQITPVDEGWKVR
jgi:hypothetical protein